MNLEPCPHRSSGVQVSPLFYSMARGLCQGAPWLPCGKWGCLTSPRILIGTSTYAPLLRGISLFGGLGRMRAEERLALWLPPPPPRNLPAISPLLTCLCLSIRGQAMGGMWPPGRLCSRTGHWGLSHLQRDCAGEQAIGGQVAPREIMLGAGHPSNICI